MKKFLPLAFASLFVLLSSHAIASADCAAHPRGQWLKQADLKQRLETEGYQIKNLKVDGNCYEIYGRNKEGKKVEIYFDTVTGKPVKTKIKD